MVPGRGWRCATRSPHSRRPVGWGAPRRVRTLAFRVVDFLGEVPRMKRRSGPLDINRGAKPFPPRPTRDVGQFGRREKGRSRFGSLGIAPRRRRPLIGVLVIVLELHGTFLRQHPFSIIEASGTTRRPRAAQPNITADQDFSTGIDLFHVRIGSQCSLPLQMVNSRIMSSSMGFGMEPYDLPTSRCPTASACCHIPLVWVPTSDSPLS